MTDLLAVAEAAARAAGAVLLEHYDARGDLEIEAKSTPTDPVSEADHEAERVIREMLRERAPDDGIVGEEGDDVPSRLCPIHRGSFKQEARRAVNDILSTIGRKLRGIFKW